MFISYSHDLINRKLVFGKQPELQLMSNLTNQVAVVDKDHHSHIGSIMKPRKLKTLGSGTRHRFRTDL